MYRVIATDIDGTLTKDRSSTEICLEVIEILKNARSMGLHVVLVSSNSLPVVIGLSKYIGLNDPVIGESGSLLYIPPNRVIHLTEYSAREAYRDVVTIFSNYVDDSWQNIFRIHDFALKVKDEFKGREREVYSIIRDYVENKYSYVKVGYSGYAIHLTPRDVSKGYALMKLLDIMGYSLEHAVCIGDSVMDADFISQCGLKVAVSNADEELKSIANYVCSKPSCYGVVEVVEKILSKGYIVSNT